jgi:hypothetical protein
VLHAATAALLLFLLGHTSFCWLCALAEHLLSDSTFAWKRYTHSLCLTALLLCCAGKLSDTRQRFLGTRAPRLFAVWVRGVRSLLALSSRPWLGYTDMGRWQFMPLSYEALDHAAVRPQQQNTAS